jgi:hypothetical protein
MTLILPSLYLKSCKGICTIMAKGYRNSILIGHLSMTKKKRAQKHDDSGKGSSGFDRLGFCWLGAENPLEGAIDRIWALVGFDLTGHVDEALELLWIVGLRLGFA